MANVPDVSFGPVWGRLWVGAQPSEQQPRHRGWLRLAAIARVAKELPLRTTPELHFELDRGLEHAQRIDQVLRDLKGGTG
jgi:hypothetical protein